MIVFSPGQESVKGNFRALSIKVVCSAQGAWYNTICPVFFEKFPMYGDICTFKILKCTAYIELVDYAVYNS